MLEADSSANRRALQDTAYTLCVITGTDEIKDALATADRLLTGERPNTPEGRPDLDEGRDDRTLVA
jgi:hypothetical protein